ncbi:MAG: hypothetical protein ACO3EY_07605, partial [Candidatus Nanopelagicales bacterium]
LAGIYPALARFGYGIARAIRPTKVASAIKKITPVAVKEAQFSPMVTKGIEGAKKKISSGYRSLYAGTLGSSTKRKVTSGVLGTYTTMSFLNGDDDEIEE